MNAIIIAKYGGRCRKCNNHIKVGSFVNWKRGHGIWHLDESDNGRLPANVSMASATNLENSYCPNTDQREENIMSPSDNDGTINVSDLIKALQGMTEKEIAVEVTKPPAKKEKQLAKNDKIKVGVKSHVRRQRRVINGRPLTDKQISFCELMALGSDRADAYTNSYNISNSAFSSNAARKLLNNKRIRDKIAKLKNELEVKDKEVAIEVVESPAYKHRRNRNPWDKKLTNKQTSFCELMALGSNKTDAYIDSYDIKSPRQGTLRAMARNASRKLLLMKKIRDRIAEFRSELGEKDTKNGVQEFLNAVELEGTGGGWAFHLTKNQEGFCQAMASGATRINAFKQSGYDSLRWSDKRTRKAANKLMNITKIKIRIANLMSGDTSSGSPAAVDEREKRIQDILAKESVKAEVADQQPATSPELRVPQWKLTLDRKSAANSEFVDNFVELIKAHGRLFHHSVVIRGQEEVGMPGADVKGVQEAIQRSIKVLRETLSEKLLANN
jgi:hypothetical protein